MKIYFKAKTGEFWVRLHYEASLKKYDPEAHAQVFFRTRRGSVLICLNVKMYFAYGLPVTCF